MRLEKWLGARKWASYVTNKEFKLYLRDGEDFKKNLYQEANIGF